MGADECLEENRQGVREIATNRVSKMTALTPNTGIRATVAVAISALMAVASAGVTWGVTQSRISQGEERDARNERRIEKLEDVTVRTQQLLERIDERTAAIKDRMDRRETK
jgi:uncharacterized coiled-coil protein SlyX